MLELVKTLEDSTGTMVYCIIVISSMRNFLILGGSTQKWLVNDPEAGKEQSLSINLPLKQGRNDFDIVYEVTLKMDVFLQEAQQLESTIQILNWVCQITKSLIVSTIEYHLISVSPNIWYCGGWIGSFSQCKRFASSSN